MIQVTGVSVALSFINDVFSNGIVNKLTNNNLESSPKTP